MPTTTEFAPRTPCWVDLSTSDLDAARGFYGTVLGWNDFEVAPAEAGYYTMALVDGQRVAGMMTASDDERKTYADNVAALRRDALAKAKPVEYRMYYADYRDVNGLKWPFRLRRARIDDDVVHDGSIPGTHFDRLDPFVFGEVGRQLEVLVLDLSLLRHLVLDRFTALTVAAEHFQDCFCHFVISPLSLVIGHWSLVIGRWSVVCGPLQMTNDQ